ALLLILDAAHQLAAAIWVGGLIHLLATMSPSPSTPALARRFSTVALGSVVTLVTAGIALSLMYVGDAGALLETAYGVMVSTKAVLLVAVLGLGVANFRLVRRAATPDADVRLTRLDRKSTR